MKCIVVFFTALFSLLFGAPPEERGPILDLKAYELVDLTHPFNEKTVYWPTSPSVFRLERLAFGPTESGFFYAANALCAPEHGGTHLDAPAHFSERGLSTEEIPLRKMVATAVVIDASKPAATDRDFRLSRQDVLDFEERYGRIGPGTMVLLRTDWSRFWPDRKAYLGDDTPGDASRLRFPGFGEDAARLLVEERKVGILGIDTASIDYGQSKEFIVHRIAAARNVSGLENLTHLSRLPPLGSTVIALPMKIEGGSGGPARVIAMVPRRFR